MFAGYSELFTVLENNDVDKVSNDTAKVIFEINIPNDLNLIKSIEAKIHEIESDGNPDYESAFDEEHSKNRQFAIITDFTSVQNPKDSAQKLINEISEIMKLPGMPLGEEKPSNPKPVIIATLSGTGAGVYNTIPMNMVHYKSKIINKNDFVNSGDFTNNELTNYISEIITQYNDIDSGYDIIFVSAHGKVLNTLTQNNIPFKCITWKIYDDVAVSHDIINRIINSGRAELNLNELITCIKYMNDNYVEDTYYKLYDDEIITDNILDKIIKG